MKEAEPTIMKYFARTKKDDRHADTEHDMYQEKPKDAANYKPDIDLI